VFVGRARVLPTPVYATRNLSFLRFHRRRHPVVSTRCFTGTVRVGVKNSTRWKSCKHVRARGGCAWACFAHGLQCLCDWRACCPARAMQLVFLECETPVKPQERQITLHGTGGATRAPVAQTLQSVRQSRSRTTATCPYRFA
jgi:hypothetical protein